MSELSTLQRDMLVEHLDDNPVAVNKTVPFRYGTQQALVKKGWVRWHPQNSITPTATVLTPSGRKALADMLAWWAEIILLAHAKAPRTWAAVEKEWHANAEFEALVRGIFSAPYRRSAFSRME
jgi:hypothetical protein